MALSKVRLDPLPNIFELRVFGEAGNPASPLSEEMRQFHGRGLVTIAGNSASVTGYEGVADDGEAWADLDAALRSHGVTEVFWERHKNGKVLSKRRRIKAAG